MAIIIVGAILTSVIIVDNLILPNLSAQLQYRWVYLILSTIAIIMLLDAVSGFTGYTLRDLLKKDSREQDISSNRVASENKRRDELYEQKRKDSPFNQDDKSE